MELNEEQFHRYARHLILDEVGEEGQARLLGARVLVVGASSGLGRAAGMAVAAAGGRVAFAARRKDRLAEAVAEAGSDCLAVECDVSDEASCNAAVASAVLGQHRGVLHQPDHAEAVLELGILDRVSTDDGAAGLRRLVPPASENPGQDFGVQDVAGEATDRQGGPGLPEESGPWDTAMPAWEKFLTEEEMWDVVMFMTDFTEYTPRARSAHSDGGH